MPVSKSQEVEVNVVGSSQFGRYPKIDLQKTFNLFISDGWLVNYAGFKKVTEVLPSGPGRGLFNSTRGNFMIMVVSNSVYKIDSSFLPVLIGKLNTLDGEVYIDENLSNQICIVDGMYAYIYNYTLPSPGNFAVQTSLIDPISSMPFFPSYVCYHNTFFLFGSGTTSPNPQSWYAFTSDGPTTTTISLVSTNQFQLQTKPDFALAVERIPGRGNNVLVLGSTVAEVWTQVGGTENYRRVQSFNIDNGLVSISTLAANDEIICWLGQNESNSPVIMVSDGSSSKRISTDGIDHLLDQIKFPQQSTAFFFRQDGHLFYQITFYNPVDNLTLIHDFTTNLFFHVCDENLNFHPARQNVFFNENTYFVSLNDGSLYNMDTTLVTYNYDTTPNSVGEEIPRIRICKTVRRKNGERFRCGEFTFVLEQGQLNENPTILPRVDMSFSKDGNASFSNIVSRELNPVAVRRNQIRWARLGQCNEITIQLRFWGFCRMVINNGFLQIF